MLPAFIKASTGREFVQECCRGFVFMRKVDHYAALSRAVAHLERDSYGARGAVYDLALLSLVKRLQAITPSPPQEEVDRELRAFRQAIRRIEFGDLDELDRRAPEPSPQRHLYREAPAPGAHRLSRVGQLRRPVLGRVLWRAVLALLVMGVGVVGYAQATGQVDLAPLMRFVNEVASLDWLTPGNGTTGGPHLAEAGAGNEPAAFTENSPGSNQLAGKAQWRTHVDQSAGKEPETVVDLDVQIPQRGLSLAMTIRRDPAQNAMSHLAELKFSGPEEVVAVLGINFRSGNRGGAPLAGHLGKVAPGLFLFGLSGEKEQARRNVELLRTQPRLDILVRFANGKAGTIAVEKGVSGERVLAEAMSKWVR